MMIGMVLMHTEFGPMARYEKNAVETGDLFSGSNPYAGAEDDAPEDKGRVLDLVLPVVVLIICCVIGMIYVGGFWDGNAGDFIAAFGDTDAFVALPWGSLVTDSFLAALTAIQNKVKIAGERKGKDMSKIQSGCGGNCMACGEKGCAERRAGGKEEESNG